MDTRRLGKIGPKVSGLGLWAMGMSGAYGPADRASSIATIRAALDAGIDLIDTGDFYGMGHNELLIAEALRRVPRESYRLSVKFGALRGPDGVPHREWRRSTASARSATVARLRRSAATRLAVWLSRAAARAWA